MAFNKSVFRCIISNKVVGSYIPTPTCLIIVGPIFKRSRKHRTEIKSKISIFILQSKYILFHYI